MQDNKVDSFYRYYIKFNLYFKETESEYLA